MPFPTEVSIQPARDVADFQAVADLAAEIWREHYSPIIGEEQVAYMLERFQSPEAMRRQSQEGLLYYHIVSEGARIGYAAVLPREKTLVLSKLYVAAPWRNRGVARKTLSALLRLHTPERVILWVNKHNGGSIAAYRRMGFEIIRSECNDIGNGFVMDDYVMERVSPAVP